MDTNENSGVLRIITVEDSPVVVERMRSMLIEIDGIEYSGNATNSNSALNLIDRHQPHVAILDINLEEETPKSNGINILIELREKYPEMVIIMFTNLIEPQYRKTCMIMGADHFFDKSNDFEKISEVLKETIQLKKI